MYSGDEDNPDEITSGPIPDDIIAAVDSSDPAQVARELDELFPDSIHAAVRRVAERTSPHTRHPRVK